MSWPEHCPSKTLGKFQWVTGGTIGWMWLRSGLASQNDRVKLRIKLENGSKWYNMVQPRVLNHMVKSEGFPRAVAWGLCHLLHSTAADECS